MDSLMTWRRRLALWSVTLLAAAFSFGAHVVFAGGWCGYFDGGPQGEQVEFCEAGDDKQFLISSVPGVLVVLGAIAASFPRRTRAALVYWAVGLLLALIFWLVVPFALYDDPAYPAPWVPH
jgi:hypothetical protein